MVIPLAPALVQSIDKRKEQCEAKGGTWNEATKTCTLPTSSIKDKPKTSTAFPLGGGQTEPLKPTQPSPTSTKPQPPAPPGTVVTDSETGEVKGFINDQGNFVKAGREDIQNIIGKQQAKTAPIEGAQTTQQFAQARQGAQLARQIGQFDQLGISPTGLDIGEGVVTGLTDAIPAAIKSAGAIAGGGAVIGGAIGTAGGPLGTGGGAALGAAIGGAAGFTGSLASSMISSFKGQRRDTTTAQQRVLDEGKQTMADWVTMAANDPINRARYLNEYNKVASQIDQAYRQMKLDTSLDVTKFETALPNLAEFEAFYADGGEKDVLDADMQTSLLAPTPPEYAMLELTNRRLKNSSNN